MTRSTLRLLAVAFVSSLVLGCGGGGGGDGDMEAPKAVICFPTAVSLTDGATVTVRGTASDDKSITAVAVNGVPATTTDGFAHWVVDDLPIVVGANLLTVSTLDSVGNADASAATAMITRDPNATTTGTVGGGVAVTNFQDVVIDPLGGRLLVLDDGAAGTGSLLAISLATGLRTTISMDAIGGGLPATMPEPRGLTVRGILAYATDEQLDLVIEINLLTGFRQIISDSASGFPDFMLPEGITYDATTDRLYWLDQAADRVLWASILAGNARSIVSDNTKTGPAIASPDRIVLDLAGNRVLFTERVAGGSILAADLGSGNKTTIASGAVGTGGPAGFSLPTGLVHEFANNRVVTQLAGSDATVFVNLANGNRTVISDNTTVGVGPAFNAEVALAYDIPKQQIYVLDVGVNAVYVVDVASGDRVILSK